MRKSAIVLLGLVSLLMADPTVNPVGIGVRAYGMANNFTALAHDFSALFWNPAGFAFVPVREAHCAIGFERTNAATDFGGNATDASFHRFRIASAGLLRSVPTVRGGFAFALGFSSPWLLDDLNNFSGNDVYRGSTPLPGYSGTLNAGDTLARDRSNHSSRGHIGMWSAGLGWQVAPALGFGFSIGLLTGSESREIEKKSHTNSGNFEDLAVATDREYLGYDARLGLLYKPTRQFSAGLRIEIPRYAKVAENYTELNKLSPGESYETTFFGALQSSFAGAVGAALELPFMTLTTDVTFRSPLSGSPTGTNASRWKEGVGLGIEVPVRPLASVVRAGYSYSSFDLSPMQISWDSSGVDPAEPLSVLRNNYLFTAGYSLLVGSNVSFDLAYGCRVWEFSSADPLWQTTITERHSLQRGAVSVSIRY